MADTPDRLRLRTGLPPQPPPRQEQRFVPSGVDAQTWLGFEQRIQQRRYQALLQQIDAALLRRDAVAAHVALEEAYELRPEAAELGELSRRVMLLPVAPPPAGSVRFAWSRTMSAVAMLVAGVALLVGIEWVRPTPSLPSRAVVPVVVSSPTTTGAAPTAQTPPVSTPADSVEIVRPRAEPDAPEPVATAGIRRAVNITGPAVGGPAAATFRQAVLESRDPSSDGEIPDDYVAPQPRRQPEADARPSNSEDGTASLIGTGNAPQQAVAIAQPASPVVQLVASAPVAATAAPVATPPPSRSGDETRVAQVLNQYARAYGQLDARAARRVWPSVDERALARAFADLESQDVSFENCSVNVSGETATASCRGRASYVGKVGSHEPRTETRQWTFELHRDANDAWQIESAQAQRVAYQER